MYLIVDIIFSTWRLCFSVAGTTGAIVTCPLEVVKTRQQSSKSGFVVVKDLDTISNESTISKTSCRTISDQRRRLWTTCLYSRPQVVALSGYTTTQPIHSLSIIQCLRHIIQHEGPMALFKGNKVLHYLLNVLRIVILLLQFQTFHVCA